MIDSIELFADEFARLTLTKFCGTFLGNKKEFFKFIKANVSSKNDRNYLRVILKKLTESSNHTEKQTFVNYNTLQAIIGKIYEWKYQYTGNTPFDLSKSKIVSLKDDNRNIFHHGVIIGDTKTFIKIAEHCKFYADTLKSSINLEWLLSSPDTNEFTPLHYAVNHDSYDIIRYCIENFPGLALHKPSNIWPTLLEFVINKDNIELIKIFRAETETWDQWLQREIRGKYLLHIAVEMNAINFLKFLKTQNINWNLFDRGNGNSVLHIAVASRQLSLVKFILTCCRHLKDFIDHHNCTPISLAVAQIKKISGDNTLVAAEKEKRVTALVEIVKYLLEQKAAIITREQQDISKLMKKHGYVLADEYMEIIIQHRRREIIYRAIVAIICIFSIVFAVTGFIYIALGTEPPGFKLTDLGIGTATFTITAIATGICFFNLSLDKFLEVLGRPGRSISAQLHRRTHYAFSDEQQNQNDLGFGIEDIEKGLKIKNTKAEVEAEVEEEITKTANEFLAKNLHRFILGLSHRLEKIPGAPRLGVVEELLEELKRTHDNQRIVQKLAEDLDRLTQLPIPGKARTVLTTAQAQLKCYAESHRFTLNPIPARLRAVLTMEPLEIRSDPRENVATCSDVCIDLPDSDSDLDESTGNISAHLMFP